MADFTGKRITWVPSSGPAVYLAPVPGTTMVVEWLAADRVLFRHRCKGTLPLPEDLAEITKRDAEHIDFIRRQYKHAEETQAIERLTFR